MDPSLSGKNLTFCKQAFALWTTRNDQIMIDRTFLSGSFSNDIGDAKDNA